LFYIQDTTTYVGDFILWWRPDRKGYTTNLDEAGAYTEEAARAIERLRGTDRAWPVSAVQAGVTRAVDVEKLRKARPSIPPLPPAQSPSDDDECIVCRKPIELGKGLRDFAGSRFHYGCFGAPRSRAPGCPTGGGS